MAKHKMIDKADLKGQEREKELELKNCETHAERDVILDEISDIRKQINRLAKKPEVALSPAKHSLFYKPRPGSGKNLK